MTNSTRRDDARAARRQALWKLAFLALFWVVAELLIFAIKNEGAKPGNLAALPVLPLVLSLVPVLEFLTGSPFTEVSRRWDGLRSWQQWGIVLLTFALIFGVFVLLVAVFAGPSPTATNQ